MQIILDILKMAGGLRLPLYLKIENAPYLALVIEATPEPGSMGLPALSVAHYGEQNGDLRRALARSFMEAVGMCPMQIYWRTLESSPNNITAIAVACRITSLGSTRAMGCAASISS